MNKHLYIKALLVSTHREYTALVIGCPPSVCSEYMYWCLIPTLVSVAQALMRLLLEV